MNDVRSPQHRLILLRKDRTHLSNEDQHLIGSRVKHVATTHDDNVKDLLNIGEMPFRFHEKDYCCFTSYNFSC